MCDYQNAIEISGLTKHYDGFTLDNVSFSVPVGSIMGFIGQNGAGKSTTIKAILNIIGVDGGEIKLLGKDYIKDEYEVKSQIAAVFDELPFYDKFNAVQINTLFRGLYKTWEKEKAEGFLKGNENEAANRNGTFARRKAADNGRGDDGA